MFKWIKRILPLSVLASVALAANLAAAQTLPQSVPADAAPVISDTLYIEAMVNLGVQPGNATNPRRVALNESAGRLYLLSEGRFSRGEGLRLSEFDPAARQFTNQLELASGDNEALDLQTDSDSGLVYALWNTRYAATRPTLTVVDGKVMQPAQSIPDVESFAVGNGILYAANADELFSVNLSLNNLAQAQRVELPAGSTVGPLAVSPESNRLYLALSSGPGWDIAIFEAGTLTPLTRVPANNRVLEILPLPGGEQILYTTDSAGFRVINRITADGELADLPFELGPHSGARGIALAPTGDTLFFSNGRYRPTGPDDPSPGPALVGLNSATLEETHFVSLPNNVEDVAVSADGAAFAVYPYDQHLYQIDTAAQDFDIFSTAVSVRDVLADPETGRLFVTDSANRVRQLDPESLEVLDETRLLDNWDGYGFKGATWGGEMALDGPRGRLYVSGLPASVLDAGSLAEERTLNPGGQFAVDPGGQFVYLTHCGVRILDAESLTGDDTLPGSAARDTQLVPNPCATAGRIDPQNQRFYALVDNGVPGSNGGTTLRVYNLQPPRVVYSDTEMSVASVEPDPAADRAFVSSVRNSNQRVRVLNTPAGQYTEQLFGVWGDARYFAAANRLYLYDDAHKRLLVLDDSLAVVGELPLPADSYRLVELDSATGRLYLAGSDGMLLVAAPGPPPPDAAIAASPPDTRPANGAVLSLSAPVRGRMFARINAHFDDFSKQARLYSSRDAGKVWADLGPGLSAQQVQALAVSPNFADDRTLFAAVLVPGQTGGLYRSTDGGQTWQPAMRGLRDLWVTRMFIDPDFAKTGLIFAETPYTGLHASTDGGQTWQPLLQPDPNGPFPFSNSGHAAAFDARGGLLVSQNLDGMRGLFRARLRPNGTLSPWRQVFDRPAAVIGLSPNGQTALAFGQNLWHSSDGGRTWQIGGAGLGGTAGLENLKPQSFIFSPDFSADRTVYLFFSDELGSSAGVLFRSTDGGQTWQPWRAPEPDKKFTAVTLAPNGDFLLGDEQSGVTRISPASIQWARPSGSALPLDDLIVSPNFARDRTLFAVGKQQGLFKSTNGGRGWQQLDFPARTLGYSAAPYRLAVSPNFADDRTLFAATGASLHKSTNGGRSWQQLAPPGDSFSFAAQRVAVSPNFAADQTVLAAIPAGVVRSTDGGQTWQATLSPPGDELVSDLLLFAPNGDAFARFGYGSDLYRSEDGGQTWQAQPVSGDPYITLISAGVDSTGRLSAAVEYGRNVLQTDALTPPWRDAGQNLPDALSGVDALAVGPDGALFVAGSGGIFRSDDNGQSWEEISSFGLPSDVAVTGLRVAGTSLIATLDSGQMFHAGDFGWKDISVLK